MSLLKLFEIFTVYGMKYYKKRESIFIIDSLNLYIVLFLGY